jgi:arginase
MEKALHDSISRVQTPGFTTAVNACKREFRPVRILGAASGFGASDQGCVEGPIAMRRLKLDQALRRPEMPVSWHTLIKPVPPWHDVAEPFEQASNFLERLANRLIPIVHRREHFLVLGGDHSCAIGTWSAATVTLKSQGPLGLIWIDAHMDSHTPETSISGALHGMPLAALLGHGHRQMIDLIVPGPKLAPEYVCLVGVRSYEAGEYELLQRLGVRVIFMAEVNRMGLATALAEALAIARNGTAGFGLSIDLDAIDPQDAPGVGTPVPGGIHGQELLECMTLIAAQKQDLIGLEIAELNPARDRDGVTAKLVYALCQRVFQ